MELWSVLSQQHAGLFPIVDGFLAVCFFKVAFFEARLGIDHIKKRYQTKRQPGRSTSLPVYLILVLTANRTFLKIDKKMVCDRGQRTDEQRALERLAQVLARQSGE